MSASASHDRLGARETGADDGDDQRIITAASYLQRPSQPASLRRALAGRKEPQTAGALPPIGGADWRRQVAATAARLIFVLIVFLVGLFIGASFGTDLPAFMRPEINISLRVPAAPTQTATGTAAKAAAAKATADKPPAHASPTPTTARQTAPASPAPTASQPPPEAVTRAHANNADNHHTGSPAAKTPTPPATAQSVTARVTASAPPASPGPATRAAATEAPPPPAPGVGGTDGTAVALVARGDALLAEGDVASARLFYRRGSDAGDGTAALRMGETFDPTFLTRAHLERIAGDAAMAAYWYRRARELGNTEAAILLQSAGGVSGK